MRPPVTLLATTYFPPGEGGAIRQRTFAQALESWGRFLHYDGELFLHVADDGSPDGDGTPFATSPWAWTASQQARRGVGASLNAGFRQAFERSPLVLYAVDDWALIVDLDLTRWADLLMEREDIGMVRLGPPHPDTHGTIELAQATEDQGAWFLRLAPYAFAFAHRPALYHRRMIDAFGWFAEGVNAYECEQLYAEHYVAHCLSGPGVVLALPVPWRHLASLELAGIRPEGG